MYAIVEINGKQYKVAENTVIAVDHLKTDQKTFSCDSVLALFDDKKSDFGTPTISGAKVEFEIIEAAQKGEKIKVHTFKRKTGKQRRYGARQTETILKTKTIKSAKAPAKKESKES